MRIMKSPSRKTVTHNGTVNVALCVALGIDWRSVYGLSKI